MKNPSAFYQENIAFQQEELRVIKKRLLTYSMLRLLAFILACVVIYFVIDNIRYVIAIAAVTIFLFVYLVTQHSKTKYRRDLTLSLIAQNEVELEVLDRKFHHLPNGEKYSDPLHFYSQDIDLFGRGSFFQYMNRTALESGSDYLAHILTENRIDAILEKQQAIQEIAEKSTWRQRFTGIASLVKTETSVTEVTDWLKGYKAFAPNWIVPASILFPIVSVGFFILNYLGLLSGYITAGWFILGFIITGIYAKKINALSAEASKLQSIFDQFHQLILEVENESFSSEILTAKRNLVVQSDTKTSTVLKKFSRYLDVLGQGDIMLFGPIINGFTLRNLRQCYNIEQWIKAYEKNVPAWFEVITFFDAYNSLGNFAFNHPAYSYPTISDGDSVLNIKGAGHPLLHEATMVKNDIQINSEEFFIVTGANMAGKSTFLRTVSLQIVMGNIGLPVCADAFTYSPIKLITSMRTTDSLTDDESYFFSELKRLKFIVDEIKTDRYFIILDEILKGTNSTDKAIGSRKFVEKLVGSNSTGIIATHDLSLCAAADELSEVKNYYFDAQIIDDELFFDYTFKPGICENMNASFLLKKMEIVD